MKRFSFLFLFILFLFPTVAFAKLPLPIISEGDLGKEPSLKGLSPCGINNSAKNNALGEHGIFTLLKLTPKTAEEKFGNPEVEVIYEGKGKSYKFSNGIGLSFFKGKLATIYYDVPKDAALPYKSYSINWLGFGAGVGPDFENEHVIKWEGGTGDAIKEITITPGAKENDKVMMHRFIINVFSPEY